MNPLVIAVDTGNRQGINADLIHLQSQTFPGIVSRADHPLIGRSFQIAGIPGKARQNGQQQKRQEKPTKTGRTGKKHGAETV